jgi:hypothetical protein
MQVDLTGVLQSNAGFIMGVLTVGGTRAACPRRALQGIASLT